MHKTNRKFQRMFKPFFSLLAIVGISLILISWGSVGHSKISYNASLSFNQEMSIFSSWINYLTDHASDADSRKSIDPTESPKHYIDIDNYSDFNSSGSITQDYTAAVAKYGLSFINSNGSLPWATQAAFDSLKNCLKRNDIAKAKQFAADLGHYVADGHMPLHITKNYDGQLTGNSGIHSRYESNMIGSFNSQITYTGANVSVIADVNRYIFDYIYTNYKYKDSIILADNFAKTQSNYNQALWDKTKRFTTILFKNASHALAELMYTALVQSQSSTDVSEPRSQFTEVLEQNSPNPFRSITSIRYNLSENSDVSLQVKDVLGNNVTTLYQGYQIVGSYTISWTPQNLTEGIYFIVMDTRKTHQVKRMMLIR